MSQNGRRTESRATDYGADSTRLYLAPVIYHAEEARSGAARGAPGDDRAEVV